MNKEKKEKMNIINDNVDPKLRKKILDTLDNQSAINIQMNFWFNEMMKYHGVNYSEYRIMRLLTKYPEGVEPSVIADKLTILRQTVTNMVDSLQKSFFVERIPHPVDRRRIYVKLTQEGRTLADKLIDEMAKVQTNVLSKFTKEEMLEYLEIRMKIIEYTENEIKCRYIEECKE